LLFSTDISSRWDVKTKEKEKAKEKAKDWIASSKKTSSQRRVNASSFSYASFFRAKNADCFASLMFKLLKKDACVSEVLFS